MLFSCHRAIAPMLWVLVILSVIELTVTHAVIVLWFPRVALALSIVTVAGIGWLVFAIRSLKRLPCRVEPSRLVMRAGIFRGITIAGEDVAGLRAGGWTQSDVKAPATLNLAMVAFPNIFIDLRRPVKAGWRNVTAVAHRLDDPAGFAAALHRLGGDDDR